MDFDLNRNGRINWPAGRVETYTYDACDFNAYAAFGRADGIITYRIPFRDLPNVRPDPRTTTIYYFDP